MFIVIYFILLSRVIRDGNSHVDDRNRHTEVDLLLVITRVDGENVSIHNGHRPTCGRHHEITCDLNTTNTENDNRQK